MTKKTKPADKTLFLIVISLLFFSLFIIYNATAYYAQYTFGSPFRFVYLQIMWIAVGLFFFLFFSKLDYKKIKSLSFLLFTGSLVLLFILGVVGLFVCRDANDLGIVFAPCLNGASRWLFLNPEPFPPIPFIGVIGLQPGELAKLAVILYLSVQLSKFDKKKHTDTEPFVFYIVTTALISFFLLLQPNMSTAVLIFLIGTVIYFVSGYSLKPLILASPLILVVGLVTMLSSAYRRARLLTLLGLSSGEELEAGYHIKQVLIALGSGGFLGVGFGQSRQKYQYLPEVASDSIFAIIGEEFGFLGAAIVIFVFGYLIHLGIKVAKNAPDNLGKMLATGVTSWIAIQFFINVSAMTQLIPLTGMPIPLISYGGSSMVFTLIGLGILNNIQSQGNG